MKNKRDCKIIQDLLPNYIEKLTTDETNRFIDEHIESCEDCKNIYDNMKAKFENKDTLKVNKNEINYLKKYNRKLRIFMGIVFVILIIFVINYARKLIIYNDLESKLNNYKNSNNYYMKVTGYYEGELNVEMKFKKDDKYMIRHEGFYSKDDTGKSVRRMYSSDNQDTANWYISSGDEKYSQLNLSEKGLDLEIPEYLYEKDDSLLKYLKMVLFSSCESEKCNGKDCYKITKTQFKDDKLTCFEKYNKEYIYVEKDTGLIVRTETNMNRGIRDYDYTFNAVTDETLKEPDLNEYKEIKEEEIKKQIEEHKDLVSKINSVEIQIEDKNSKEGISYTDALKLENHYKLYDLSVIINDSEKFEDFDEIYGAGGYFEGCPIVTVYTEDGEKLMITACDNFSQDENGKWINIMGVNRKDDFSDTEIYKVKGNLMKFIEELYNENI